MVWLLPAIAGWLPYTSLHWADPWRGGELRMLLFSCTLCPIHSSPLTHHFSRYQHKSVLNAHLRLRLNRDERIAICPGFILGCEGQWCGSRSSASAQTQAAGPCYLCHQNDTYRMIVSVLSLCSSVLQASQCILRYTHEYRQKAKLTETFHWRVVCSHWYSVVSMTFRNRQKLKGPWKYVAN